MLIFLPDGFFVMDDNIKTLIMVNKGLTVIKVADYFHSVYCFNNNINNFKFGRNLINFHCDMFVILDNINNNELRIYFW